MKRIITIAVLAIFCLTCTFILAGCGDNYESVVKKQFVEDCALIGSSTLQGLGTSDSNSVIPPDEGDVDVTTITEGEEYKAEGDLAFRSTSGELSFHCTGTYRIDEEGNAESVDWDIDY